MTLFQASFSFTRLILPAETSWFRVASDSLDFLAALFSAMKPHVAQLAIVDSLLTAALIRSGFTPSYPSRDRRPFLAHEGFLAGYPIPLVIGRLSVDLEKLPRSPCNRIHYSLGNGNEEPSAPPHRASRVQNCSREGTGDTRTCLIPQQETGMRRNNSSEGLVVLSYQIKSY